MPGLPVTPEVHEARRDAALAALGADPLSPQARSHRRGSLITAAISLVLIHLELVPREISAIGVTLEADSRRGILIALLALLAYFTITFLIYGAIDFVAWRNTRRDAAASRRYSRRTVEGVQNRYKEMLQRHAGADDDERKRMAPTVALSGADLFDARTRRADLEMLAKLWGIRGLIDFGIPIALSLWAIETLIASLW